MIANHSGTGSCVVLGMQAVCGALAVLELLHFVQLGIHQDLYNYATVHGNPYGNFPWDSLEIHDILIADLHIY